MARLVNSADDEILLASRQGQISRFKAAEVRCPKSRSSRGVRLLALNELRIERPERLRAIAEGEA